MSDDPASDYIEAYLDDQFDSAIHDKAMYGEDYEPSPHVDPPDVPSERMAFFSPIVRIDLTTGEASIESHGYVAHLNFSGNPDDDEADKAADAYERYLDRGFGE